MRELRVLGLYRRKGGCWLMMQHLIEPLASYGIELVLDDASSWIPNETGWRVDKVVKKQFAQEIRGFDVVHAMSFRCAWAASNALYISKPWVYSAYDLPPTYHPELIDALNAARFGICTSRSVRARLDESDALNLTILVPGVPDPGQPLESNDCREALGIHLEGPVIVAAGRLSSERSFDALIEAFPSIRHEIPGAQLVIVGEGPDAVYLQKLATEAGTGVTIIEQFEKRFLAFGAADLVVNLSKIQGFSMPVAEAMLSARAVAVLEKSGVSDLISDRITGYELLRENPLDEQLTEIVRNLETTSSIGNYARTQALAKFDLNTTASRLANIYREAFGA